MEITRITSKDIAVKDREGALAALGATALGLSDTEVLSRRKTFGPNEITGKEITRFEIFVRQFRSAFIYLLLGATALSLYLAEYLDAGIIFLFLLINAFLGYFQEYRAENALKLLKSFIERKTRVRRDGKEVTIAVKDIVPGDIILLDAGDMIPADGYFVLTEAVTVDESPMTGETIPVEKVAAALLEVPQDIYKASNIGFSRTTLLSGTAEMLIFATGNNTEVGTIAEKMQEAESPSAFEEGVNHFSKFILKLVLATVPVVFLLHTLVQGDGVSLGNFLLFSIALTVSAIPEALPLVTTISLSRGALRLAQMHVVPRRLSAIEDLGSINILATDKTGTITENKLSVGEIYGERNELLRYALMAPLSAPDASSVQNSVFDIALKNADDAHIAESLASLHRLDEVPFDPTRRKESVLVEIDGKRLIVVRGAPEVLCNEGEHVHQLAWGKDEGKKGRRILAVSFKEVGNDTTQINPDDTSGFNCIGMVSFSDPLKASTKSAVENARKLGVMVKIITGDSKEVAGWVGYEAGILTDPTHVLLGDEFARMSAVEQAVAVMEYSVFARTTPVQKFEIIKKLEEKNLVGFLGEGFNDAPALKMAHVGLAVEGASDIAQDASDIILLNPSLGVIVDGIKEGRTIFANSMKYIRATLTSNFGNFYALAFSSLFISYLPMLPIQVLLLNLLSDFPMISIATDTVDDYELEKPRGYNIGEITAIAIVLGVVSTLFDFAFFGYFMHQGEKALQTMWFIGSILTELILLFSIRTALPFWKAKFPSATVLWLTLGAMVITVALPLIPSMRALFGFVVPTAGQWGMAALLVVLYFIFTEAVKLLFYRYWAVREKLKN